MKKNLQFLRWAGSKKRLIPKLSNYWYPGFKRYIEPFMGSACLFFELMPQRAILSDINVDLINTFNVVRDYYAEVHSRLLTQQVTKEDYYRIRAINSTELDKIGQAVRFIYLNRFCFNGLYRTNSKGQFNVPFTSGRTGGLPSLDILESVSSLLKIAELRCCDFEETIDDATAGDFVYLDPPYAISGKRIFREYYPNSFGGDDIPRLKRALENLDSKNVKFVLSYAFSAEIMSEFKRWEYVRLKTQRNISGFSKHRRKSEEVLFSNFSPHNFETTQLARNL